MYYLTACVSHSYFVVCVLLSGRFGVALANRRADRVSSGSGARAGRPDVPPSGRQG